MAKRITLILIMVLVPCTALLVLGVGSYTRSLAVGRFDDLGRHDAFLGAEMARCVLEKSLDDGVCDAREMFETTYQPVHGPGTSKYHTKYDGCFAGGARSLYDGLLRTGEVSHAYVVNIDGYIPAHTDAKLCWTKTTDCPLPAGFRSQASTSDPTITAGPDGAACREYSWPITVKGRPWGQFRVGIPAAVVSSAVQWQVTTAACVAGAFSAILIGLVCLAARRALRPLARLTGAASRLAGVDLAPQADGEAGGEIGQVLHALDTAGKLLETQDKAARDCQERFLGLVESSRDIVWELDAQGRYVYVSPRIQQVLGYEASEVIGKSRLDFVLPEETPRVRRLLGLRAACNERIDGLENTHLHKDGRHVVLETSAVPLAGPDGSLAGFCGVDRDVTQCKQVERELADHRNHLEQLVKEHTAELSRSNDELHSEVNERRRAETELRESERRFRLLFETSADTILIMKNGWIADCNSKGLAMFGCELGQITGDTLHRFSPKEQPDGRSSERAIKERIELASAGQPQSFEWTCRRYDEATFDVEISLNRLELAGEVFLQAIVRDISERKRAQEALRNAKEYAEAANKAKSEFLANMSHEIRTPMTAIMGYTDLLMDRGLSQKEQDNCMAVIRRNGEHLLELINGILDLSKIEAGKLAIEKQPCNPVDVLTEVVNLMRIRAQERGISLSIEYAGRLPERMLTDASRLRQALVNLAGNAIKFTESGGVRMIASFLPSWRRSGGAVRIEVVDTGIGIAEESLSRLFEPFVQADGSTSRKYGGTGLGLAITRHVAELLNGELTAVSAPGRGSTFTLTIPAGSLEGVRMLSGSEQTTEAGGERLERPTVNRDALGGVRILLAEDGPDNQALISTVLARAGAEVEIAVTGKAAVAKAEAGHFDVVLMDMQMPEMDGYEATRVLRSGGYSRPILALTAHTMSGDVDRCLAAGCDAHLSKPIERHRLVQAVAEFAAAQAGQRRVEGPRAAGEAVAKIPSPLSTHAGDPDLAEVVARFVAGLAGRVTAMQKALNAGRYEALQRYAHQLKGAGGSYGYPSLTTEARALEDAARAQDSEVATLALGRLAEMAEAIAKSAAISVH